MAENNASATMKAVLQPDKHSHKLIQAECPVPLTAGPHDILVKVHATSPCKGELDWAAWMPDYFPHDKTPIPGQDLAGTVVSAPSTSRFRPGDDVYTRVDARRPGAAAEYTVVPESELGFKPKNLSWVEAAAVPISALTAYQALFTQGTLDPAALVHQDGAARARNAEKRVLITAGAGAVGTWALQLARAAGVTAVVAVVGAKNVDFAKEYGATETIVYTEEQVGEWVKKDQRARECDLIIDCVGGATLKQSWYALKEGGKLVSVCSEPEKSRPQDVETTADSLFFVITPLGADLDVISELVDAGKLRVSIDSVYDFDQFQEAFDKAENGRPRGKVILKVSEEAN